MAQGGLKAPNAEPSQSALDPIDQAGALTNQALALTGWTLGILLLERRDLGHAAVAPFATQPPQEPALQQLGVKPVGFRPAMLPRYREARGTDHVRLYSTRRKPARQPKAVAACFEG